MYVIAVVFFSYTVFHHINKAQSVLLLIIFSCSESAKMVQGPTLQEVESTFASLSLLDFLPLTKPLGFNY